MGSQWRRGRVDGDVDGDGPTEARASQMEYRREEGAVGDVYTDARGR